MELILKALKDAQAVLAAYIEPKAPQPSNPGAPWNARHNEAVEVIGKLLGILDNSQLVEEQKNISSAEYFLAKKSDLVTKYKRAGDALESLGYMYSANTGLWFQPQVSAQPFVSAANMASADPNVEAVRKMLLDRSALGYKKYGVGTNRDDLQLADWLQHMQEELCDAAVYIQAAKSGSDPVANELRITKETLEAERKFNIERQARLKECERQLENQRNRANVAESRYTDVVRKLNTILSAVHTAQGGNNG